MWLSTKSLDVLRAVYNYYLLRRGKRWSVWECIKYFSSLIYWEQRMKFIKLLSWTTATGTICWVLFYFYLCYVILNPIAVTETLYFVRNEINIGSGVLKDFKIFFNFFYSEDVSKQRKGYWQTNVKKHCGEIFEKKQAGRSASLVRVDYGFLLQEENTGSEQ